MLTSGPPMQQFWPCTIECSMYWSASVPAVYKTRVKSRLWIMYLALSYSELFKRETLWHIFCWVLFVFAYLYEYKYIYTGAIRTISWYTDKLMQFRVSDINTVCLYFFLKTCHWFASSMVSAMMPVVTLVNNVIFCAQCNVCITMHQMHISVMFFVQPSKKRRHRKRSSVGVTTVLTSILIYVFFTRKDYNLSTCSTGIHFPLLAIHFTQQRDPSENNASLLSRMFCILNRGNNMFISNKCQTQIMYMYSNSEKWVFLAVWGWFIVVCFQMKVWTGCRCVADSECAVESCIHCTWVAV